MGKIIAAKIDVTKLQKARFFQGRNGAQYADLILLELREPDRFGNTYMVKQACSREERLNKVEMPILGSAKELGGGQQVPRSGGAHTQWNKPQTQKPETDLDEEPIPF